MKKSGKRPIKKVPRPIKKVAAKKSAAKPTVAKQIQWLREQISQLDEYLCKHVESSMKKNDLLEIFREQIGGFKNRTSNEISTHLRELISDATKRFGDEIATGCGPPISNLTAHMRQELEQFRNMIKVELSRLRDAVSAINFNGEIRAAAAAVTERIVEEVVAEEVARYKIGELIAENVGVAVRSAIARKPRKSEATGDATCSDETTAP